MKDLGVQGLMRGRSRVKRASSGWGLELGVPKTFINPKFSTVEL